MLDPNSFPHHRLHVFEASLELAVTARSMADRIPRGVRNLADQLMRASTSIPLLIAEGANRRTSPQKRQRFVEARGETGEAAAAFELAARLDLVPVEVAEEGVRQAAQVAAMLSGLIRRHS